MSISVTGHIAPIAETRDAFLLDLWGVVHNGVSAHPGALRVLAALHEMGKQVILLSNAPRLGVDVTPFLTRLGVPPDHYMRVVASGDLVRRALGESADTLRLGRRFLFWGKQADRSITAGLDLEEVSAIDDADFILCAGFQDDHTESIDDYAELLARARRNDKPLICANPDYEVMKGARILPCAGALARRYQELGGATHWFGKPWPVAYAYCQDVLGGMAPARILAVGDTLRTDIAGAAAAGIDSVLITGGIHARAVMPGGRLDKAALNRICDEAALAPLAAMTELDW